MVRFCSLNADIRTVWYQILVVLNWIPKGESPMAGFLDWIERKFNIAPPAQTMARERVAIPEQGPLANAYSALAEFRKAEPGKPEEVSMVQDIQYVGDYLIEHDPEYDTPYTVYCKTHLKANLGADGFSFRTREEALKFVRWMS